MESFWILISILVCATTALPAYEEIIDTIDDPHNYKNIEILLLESAVDQDGGYSFSFENDDGSKVSQEGQHKIVDDEHAIESISGSYSYNDVNGQPVSLTYTADENGFRPVGAHLPTPPPVPLEILRSLRFLATAKPFVDDQLYDYKPKKKVFRGRQYNTLNAVQRSRSNLRSKTFAEPQRDDTPSETTILKSAELSRQNSEPETSTKGTTASRQATTSSTKKPAVESAIDVLNDGRQKIKDSVKESIDKTSKLTQSATKETADAAIAAIREEATKLTDVVNAHATVIKDKITGTGAAIEKEVTVPAKQSREIIEKYTGLVSTVASDADKALGLVSDAASDVASNADEALGLISNVTSDAASDADNALGLVSNVTLDAASNADKALGLVSDAASDADKALGLVSDAASDVASNADKALGLISNVTSDAASDADKALGLVSDAASDAEKASVELTSPEEKVIRIKLTG